MARYKMVITPVFHGAEIGEIRRFLESIGAEIVVNGLSSFEFECTSEVDMFQEFQENSGNFLGFQCAIYHIIEL